MDDLEAQRPVAPPALICEAWQNFMGAPEGRARDHAIRLLRQFPPPDGMVDPIFMTPEFNFEGERVEVWHMARDITNPRAMEHLRKYIHDHGYSLPPELAPAWTAALERKQWAEDVRARYEELIETYIDQVSSASELLEMVAYAMTANLDA